jgi:hypothetical protein
MCFRASGKHNSFRGGGGIQRGSAVERAMICKWRWPECLGVQELEAETTKMKGRRTEDKDLNERKIEERCQARPSRDKSSGREGTSELVKARDEGKRNQSGRQIAGQWHRQHPKSKSWVVRRRSGTVQGAIRDRKGNGRW